MFIKNLSIGKKISASFLIIALINIAFGFFLIKELNLVKSELLNYTDDTLPALENVDAIRDKISYWRRTQFAVFAMTEQSEIQQTIARNERVRQEIETELAAYGKTVWPGEEQQTYNRLMSIWKGYVGSMDKFNDALLAGDKDTAYPILTNSLSTFESIETEVTKLVGILKDAMDSNKNRILTSVTNLNTSSMVSNIVIFALMVVMTLFLTRIICGPLNLVVRQANAIARGDLSQTLDRNAIGNDELGELADATIKMQDDLRQVIDNVIAAVTQLSSAVEEMAQISEMSASGMKDQQMQVTLVATAMTEMKAAVGDVARNTEDSAAQANDANRRTQEGAKETGQMVSSIEEVAEIIAKAGDTVAELKRNQARSMWWWM